MFSYAQLCPTLCNHMDSSLPGSSVRGIFQATMLEQVAISFSRGSSRLRDRTHISCISCIGRQFLYLLSHGGSPLIELIVCKRVLSFKKTEEEYPRQFRYYQGHHSHLSRHRYRSQSCRHLSLTGWDHWQQSHMGGVRHGDDNPFSESEGQSIKPKSKENYSRVLNLMQTDIMCFGLAQVSHLVFPLSSPFWNETVFLTLYRYCILEACNSSGFTGSQQERNLALG